MVSATYLTGKVYYWKIKQVKKQIKLELAHGQIDFDKIFVFAENELKDAVWIHSREFRLNETMYDVYKTDTCDGVLIYHVFQDDKESAWATLLIEHYRYQTTNAPLQSGKDFSPLKYLMKDLISQSLLSTNYFSCSSSISAIFSLFFISSFYTPDIFSPPKV